MEGHHLVLGELTDFLTGDILEDTHDERYRQRIAKILVRKKGFEKTEVVPRTPLTVGAGELRGVIRVDFAVALDGRIAMIVKYGPGSLVTRHRPVLAMARLLVPYRIPVAVVTNGETADVLDTGDCRKIASGLDGIPSRSELAAIVADADFEAVSDKRREMESRIVYAYEIDGACPCDTTVCRLSEEESS